MFILCYVGWYGVTVIV